MWTVVTVVFNFFYFEHIQVWVSVKNYRQSVSSGTDLEVKKFSSMQLVPKKSLVALLKDYYSSSVLLRGHTINSA